MSDVLLGHLHEDIIQPHQIASGKIFVSYSRKNRDFAKALYAKLDRMGFTLWRDVHDIEAGADDWWQSIQEAIRECETVILCMSMPALKSSVVADEWYYARTLGKRIIPVIVDEIWEDEEVKSKKFTIPNWMTRKNWMDFRANTSEVDSVWANFIRTLNEKYEPKRFINMVGELPPRFVRRPDELNQAVQSLVDDNNDAVAMTTALKGAGGYGKTTLAKAVARDIRIQGAFDDGILWVTLGEELLNRKGDELKNALIGRVLDLIYALTGERVALESLEMARTKLAEAIGDLYILLVIDDVWDEAHLKPFLVKTKHSACLITTRNSDAIRDDKIAKQAIDKMKPIEAVELLGAGIDPDAVKAQDADLRHLARELREYPLVLALANTQIANYMTDMGLSLADAIQLAQETLHEQGVLGFDDTNADERTRAVSATLDVSIRQLQPEERQRMYKELAIFPEDAVIPLTTLEKYWGLSKVATLQFCQLLYRKTALLHSFEGVAIRIHDVFRDYLIRQWTPDQLCDLHQRLITHYGDLHNLPDTYAWLNIAYHLIGANQPKQLRDLLLTYGWLDKKLRATDTNALLGDCALLLKQGKDEPIRLIRSAISMSAHVLDTDKNALAHQLAGRLMHYYTKIDEIHTFLDIVMKTPNNLFPLDPTSEYDIMNPAGGMMLRTMKHDSSVNGAVQLGDGRLLSWSWDNTLRLWEADGKPLATLVGHTRGVDGAVQLVDGRILSWSWDSTLRLWDGDGKAIATLGGHTNGVAGAVQLTDTNYWFLIDSAGHTNVVNGGIQPADGRFLSWSSDTTLRLWQPDGTPIATMTGHTDSVRGAVQLGDGRILSWSWDNTLRLWEADGTPLATLTGHTAGVRGAVQLGDGRILSWAGSDYRSKDNTLCLWDTDGKQLATLEGHTYNVDGAVQLGDGRILSWADSDFENEDNTLRLWDSDGVYIATLEGHTYIVRGAVALSDERLLSWSLDNTLRLWEADGTPITTLTGHTGGVDGAVQLADGRILSWSRDNTLRLWDADGKPLATLTGHTGSVNGAVVLGDGRILSWSYDNTLRLWEADGTPITTLTGHTGGVWCVLQLDDGRLLSRGDDATLRLWDANGKPLAMLTGHTEHVNGAIQLADGRLVSWASSVGASKDNTPRLWDTDGTLLATLPGHTGRVWGVLQLDDGRLLSWSEDATLRLWEADGKPITTLTGHTGCVSVRGALQLTDGRILSSSYDATLRLWEADGTPLATLVGHTSWVYGAVELGDGRLLSWSKDKTLRLWDADGTPLATLVGHTSWVYGAVELGDGRILSLSEDKTLRLWNADGTPLALLEQAYDNGDRTIIDEWAGKHGYTLDDFYPEEKDLPMAGGWVQRRNTDLIITHPQTGATVHTFYGDAPFYCVVVLDGGRVLVAGDSAGRVLFLRWVGEDGV